MTRLRSTLGGVALAGAITLASAGGALADEPGQFSWSGHYVGANAGYAWGSSGTTSDVNCPSANQAGSNGCYYNTQSANQMANIAALNDAGRGSLSPKGFTGGVQAGSNLQFGNTVFGIEGDVNAFSLSASRYASVSPPFTNPVGQIVTVGTTLDTDWLATIRGRLGYAVTPMTLLYVTGGGALTSLKVSNSISDNAASLGFTTGSGGANHSEIKLGWTIGGGAEFALDSHWTLKAEYLYVDFGAVSVNSTFTSPGTSRGANSFGSQADLTANIARMGLNYKF